MKGSVSLMPLSLMVKFLTPEPYYLNHLDARVLLIFRLAISEKPTKGDKRVVNEAPKPKKDSRRFAISPCFCWWS